MAAFSRRQFAGAAVATTITASINSTDTTCSLAATTGWPSSAGVSFYVVIDPGTSVEEKCLATISGSTLTLTRGQDDTTAANHPSGATIYPVFTANDADEANEVAAKLTTKGDLLVTTGSALNRLPVGTNDQLLVADSAATNGVKWGTVSATGLASDAVTTAKMLDANVTEAKLASNAVTTAKIANGAVTAAKLDAAAAIQPTIVDAKGDIIAATAADTVARVAVGTNGQVLTADSTATAGVKWATPTTAGVTAAAGATVATSQTTTSTSYTDLATSGPSVTVTTGTTAIVIVSAKMSNNNNYPDTFMGFAVSGASTVSASDANAAVHKSGNWGGGSRTACIVLTGLTPGSNTFTAKYRVASDTGTFSDRTITVLSI